MERLPFFDLLLAEKQQKNGNDFSLITA